MSGSQGSFYCGLNPQSSLGNYLPPSPPPQFPGHYKVTNHAFLTGNNIQNLYKVYNIKLCDETDSFVSNMIKVLSNISCNEHKCLIPRSQIVLDNVQIWRDDTVFKLLAC